MLPGSVEAAGIEPYAALFEKRRRRATFVDYYCRQLKDWKYSTDVENATREYLRMAADIRGWTLARSHARAGDPSAISGYLGSGKVFGRAIVEFAERYADQNERDHAAFAAEIADGRFEAAELE